MKGFQLTTPEGQEIKFEFYLEHAPVTSKAFIDFLPLQGLFITLGFLDKKYGLTMFQNLTSYKKTHPYLPNQAKLFLARKNL